MTEKERISFKTINIYIEREYLESVIQFVLSNKQQLSKEEQISFTKSFNQYVNVLGFRNPSRAPQPLQINAYATAFEDKDEVVPFTLSTWAKLRPELTSNVITWLESEGWKDLAHVRDYQEDGGFLSEWPKKIKFDKLVKDFNKAYPDGDFSRDDIILMVFWVSGKLPEDSSVEV